MPHAGNVQIIRRDQRLPRPPEQVFDFFAAARNLEALTPPLLRFRVVTPEPIAMGKGTLIRYRLRIRGVPVSWLTEITDWQPPHRFVDEQRSGPYALWRHTHSFEADGAGGTTMRDEVRYAIGFGAVGRLAQRAFVRRDLEAIFDFRARRIEELL